MLKTKTCNENAPQFRRGKTAEIMSAIDPDVVPEEVESAEDEHKAPEEIGGPPDWYFDDFDPLEPDVGEAGHVSAQPIPTEADELVAIRGRAPPAWRRDDFPSGGPVRRSVWTPPYSFRPPDKEPEEWVCLNQKHKDALRAQ